MNQIIAVLGALLASLAAFVPAQSATPAPGPEHRKMSIMFGEWKIETDLRESPLGPAGKWIGEARVRSILGGFFQEWRYLDRRASGTAEAVELNWYDPATKRYPWQGFVSNGTIYSGTTTVDGRSWNWASVIVKGGVEYKTRGVLQVSPDGMSYTEKAEVCSADGKTWLPNFERRATKVRASK
jgi:hypothetical protein